MVLAILGLFLVWSRHENNEGLSEPVSKCNFQEVVHYMCVNPFNGLKWPFLNAFKKGLGGYFGLNESIHYREGRPVGK